MRLERVELTGFRGISRMEMTLNRDITVLIGRNGVGKTTVLDAIAGTMTPIQGAWPSRDVNATYPSIPLSGKDRRIGSDDGSVEVVLALDGPESTLLPERKLRVGSSVRESVSGQMPPRIMDLFGILQRGALQEEPRTLMVYYRQDRGFDRASPGPAAASPLQQVLQTSLQGDLQAISNLQTWWDRLDAEEARNVRDGDPAFRDPQLEAIRAIVKEIHGFSGLVYSSRGENVGLFLIRSSGERIHIDSLSSGEKAFIILLADLGRRLQVMSPTEALHEIPGIVLIDEIELNLHPQWQSEILPTLRRVFAACQFVVTTHSPQVISAVESDKVVIMTLNDAGVVSFAKPLRTRGQTSNYLLEGVFGSNERFPETDALIDGFNLAVDRGDASRATDLLKQIALSIEGDPPEMIVLRKRLSRLQASE